MLGRPIVPDRFDATFLKRARRYISLDEEAAAIEFRIRREEGPLASASSFAGKKAFTIKDTIRMPKPPGARVVNASSQARESNNRGEKPRHSNGGIAPSGAVLAATTRLRSRNCSLVEIPRLLQSIAKTWGGPVRPFIPPTPRRAVESYWRQHPIRADKLARALAALSGAPEGWVWQISSGAPLGFRAPPAPFREKAHAKRPGYCCVCGQPVFRFGWHRDLWRDEGSNRNASWHACCVAAWKLLTAPSDHVRHLRRLQNHRCALTGARLAKNAEVDHRVPLFEVWRGGGGRAERAWPAMLIYWGVPNLQVINRSAHVEKCGLEAASRARLRQAEAAEHNADFAASHALPPLCDST